MRASKLRTWGRLARLPNLFSVPGDPVAGSLLAWAATGEEPVSVAALSGAALSAVLLYLGGLFLNDYFDRDEDLRDRPDRPIPSGAVAPRTVALTGVACLIIAVLSALVTGGWPTALAAGAVAVLVIAYDVGGKRVRWLGPALMAACRAGSVMLGAVAFVASSSQGWNSVALALVAAATVWLFIFVVTVIAATETSGRPPRGLVPYLAPLAAGLGAAAGLAILGIVPPPFWVALMLGALIAAVRDGRRAAARELPVPAFIGSSIRKVILFQGAWVALVSAGSALASVAAVVAALALYFGSGAAARHFYAS